MSCFKLEDIFIRFEKKNSRIHKIQISAAAPRREMEKKKKNRNVVCIKLAWMSGAGYTSSHMVGGELQRESESPSGMESTLSIQRDRKKKNESYIAQGEKAYHMVTLLNAQQFTCFVSFLILVHFVYWRWGVCLHVCLCITYVPAAGSMQKRKSGSSGTVVTDGCESPCEYQELNPIHQEDQLVLLTALSLNSSFLIDSLAYLVLCLHLPRACCPEHIYFCK